MTSIEGSCKCGEVRLSYEGEVGTVTVCHCADCRKLQGGAGVIAAPVASATLRWTSGQALITEFESSPGKKRAFCSHCGTPLYSRRDDLPHVLRLRMGSIDTATEVVPVAHIFCNDLPPWAMLDDDLPRYPRHEPGRG
ncbi:MAG: GFA family protein [Herminiimonas sp.]|nr:GFA family protein [Herminiimonas sp.]